jgi:RNA polymerase II subunit A C-terminal domain phosphatase SSU72
MPRKKTKTDPEEEEIQLDENKEVIPPGLHFAMVCSSNMNRSMEAHKQLKRKELSVDSYGVGTMVRLPAPNNAQEKFEFGTPYRDIYSKLKESDGGTGAWYRNNGLLAMVERNVGIKDHPERWQELKTLSGKFDIVFCFEERVFDALIEDVTKREPEDVDEPKAMHVINLEVPDNTEDASIGAQVALEFCTLANQARENLDEELPNIVEEVQAKYKRSLMHMTVFV